MIFFEYGFDIKIIANLNFETKNNNQKVNENAKGFNQNQSIDIRINVDVIDSMNNKIFQNEPKKNAYLIDDFNSFIKNIQFQNSNLKLKKQSTSTLNYCPYIPPNLGNFL